MDVVTQTLQSWGLCKWMLPGKVIYLQGLIALRSGLWPSIVHLFTLEGFVILRATYQRI